MPTTAKLDIDDCTATWSARPDGEWRENAIQIRREWMMAMGLSQEEIEIACGPGAEADLDEEIAQRNAMWQIEELHATDGR